MNIWKHEKRYHFKLNAFKLPLSSSRDVALNGLFSHFAFVWKMPLGITREIKAEKIRRRVPYIYGLLLTYKSLPTNPSATPNETVMALVVIFISSGWWWWTCWQVTNSFPGQQAVYYSPAAYCLSLCLILLRAVFKDSFMITWAESMGDPSWYTHKKTEEKNNKHIS